MQKNKEKLPYLVSLSFAEWYGQYLVLHDFSLTHYGRHCFCKCFNISPKWQYCSALFVWFSFRTSWWTTQFISHQCRVGVRYFVSSTKRMTSTKYTRVRAPVYPVCNSNLMKEMTTHEIDDLMKEMTTHISTLWGEVITKGKMQE